MLKTKSYGVILVVALSAILGTGIVLADDEPIEISIEVAPATLNLNLADIEDKNVTVHADIDYEVVDLDSLELNDIPAIGTKADECGNLVVKFDRGAIVELVGPNDKTFTLVLTGKTTGDEPTAFEFEGTDTIRVKQ
jgi:hypothetical protein